LTKIVRAVCYSTFKSIKKTHTLKHVTISLRDNDFKTYTNMPLVKSDSEGIVAIGKPERQVRRASHCGSKQQ